MSEYFFATRSTPLPGGHKAAKKRDRIAKGVDKTAGYVYYRDAARNEWRGWGYCRSYGYPFDDATAREIEASWKAAGVGQ